jgi:ABC-type Mn2+/Zn2+ transport system permease subunit
VAGFSQRLYHNLMLVLIALSVIVSFQTVGTLLVFGMLIAPAGTGALLARRVEAMMAWAAAIGSLSVYFGLLASYYFDLAAGSAIVLIAIFFFFAAFVTKNVAAPRRRQSEEVKP